MSLANDLREQHNQTPEGAAARERLAARWAAQPHTLLQALEDEEPILRSLAADTLGRVGNAHAVPALLGALEGADAAFSGHLIEALTAIGGRYPETHAQSLPALVPLLTVEDRWLRVAAAEVLAGLASTYAAVAAAALPGMVEALLMVTAQTPYDLTIEAIIGIGDNALAPLQKLTTHDDPHIARQAAYLLEQIQARQ